MQNFHNSHIIVAFVIMPLIKRSFRMVEHSCCKVFDRLGAIEMFAGLPCVVFVRVAQPLDAKFPLQ